MQRLLPSRKARAVPSRTTQTKKLMVISSVQANEKFVQYLTMTLRNVIVTITASIIDPRMSSNRLSRKDHMSLHSFTENGPAGVQSPAREKKELLDGGHVLFSGLHQSRDRFSWSSCRGRLGGVDEGLHLLGSEAGQRSCRSSS